jgi:hypothetical protein
MPHVILTTSDGEKTPFNVNQAVVDLCTELLADPDAVLELPEERGTAFVPVRHVIALYVTA